MKKLLAVLLMLLMMTTAALAEEIVTATEDGFYDILFSNGYRGYCIDYGKEEAVKGDEFQMTDTSEADNNYTHDDISQHLKILFVKYFEDFFVLDESTGTYVTADEVRAQHHVWHFSDDFTGWRVSKEITDGVREYVSEGLTIPDHGYTMKKGDKEIWFDFAVMESMKTPDEDYQDFFAYKLHEHVWAEEWKTDGEHHWYACLTDDCPITDKSQMPGYGSHTGGTATCTALAQCSACGEAYGKTVPADHDGHGTYLVGVLPAGAEDGYTGDVYCSGCRNLIQKGKVIPADPANAGQAALPETGDDSSLFLWAALLLMGAAGLSCCRRRSRS